MTARAPVPAGAPQIRGADADGDLVDLIYVATDANLYKSIDALRSSAGYLLLRTGPHTLILHGKFAEGSAASPATRLYVVGDSGAIYKSSDGGATWTTLSGHGLTGVEYRMAIQGRAGGADILYLANASGLAVSMDGGATWAAGTVPPGGAPTLEVGPNTHVYSPSYESSNNAASWTAIPAGGFMETVTAAKLWSGYDNTQIIRMNLDGSSQELIPVAGTWLAGPHAFGQSDTLALLVGGDLDNTPALNGLTWTSAVLAAGEVELNLIRATSG
jgi:hypothetical protein